MNWHKLGKIFDPTTHNLSFKVNYYAQSPQTVVFDDFVRIYFSTRIKDTSGKFISKIAYLDYVKDFSSIIACSNHDVLSAADLGTFDEHGIFPINPLKVGDQIWAYTCGWSRRISVSVETSTGLIISLDEGKTFSRYGKGPVLSSSLQEPMLVGDSFVMKEANIFHMWYIFGREWFKPTESSDAERIYKIAYAHSQDGINWVKNEGVQIISDSIGVLECQALPTVIKIDEIYHMYFCYRYASDFRTNPLRSYRLGYAYSKDGMLWHRADELKGIDVSDRGWDSEMMCYPHIFKVDHEVYLLYNGNNFGREGFGLARLVK